MRQTRKAISGIARATATFLTFTGGSAAAGQLFEVRLDNKIEQPVAGRLFVVASPVTGATPQAIETYRIIKDLQGVSADPSATSNTAIAAVARARLLPGGAIEFDADALASPAFSSLKPGKYYVQAKLDVDGNAAYQARANVGDVVSKVVVMDLPAARPVLVLDQIKTAGYPLWDRPEPKKSDYAESQTPERDFEAAKKAYDERQEVKASATRVDLPSKLLTAFYGRPTFVRAYVLTPPGYQAGTGRYPVVFRAEGFGADITSVRDSALGWKYQSMKEGRTPPMIWVFLDHSGPTGTHEFADSVNNGPWGQALTEEFIPWLDKAYRTDGKASGRFLSGHSSGGWAALWLQVRYPKLFGGAWPTAPDPSDFRNFTNIDLYAPGANAYRLPDGSPTPLVRSRGRVAATFEEYARNERVMGDYGGQLASFEWVFSPRGPDGRPQPLFDRDTGAIDPQVAAYWREHYDISHILRRDWKTLKPDLDGKIHLWVGTADTFYLDGSARLLKATLDDLGARSEFHFVEGADHISLAVDLAKGNAVVFDALESRLSWEMYAKARPGSALRPPADPPGTRRGWDPAPTPARSAAPTPSGGGT